MLVSNDALRFFVCQNDAMVNILRKSGRRVTLVTALLAARSSKRHLHLCRAILHHEQAGGGHTFATVRTVHAGMHGD